MMVGNKISDLFKTSHEIPVFALSRENKLLWNPEPDVQLRYDDVIICYGELNQLRASLKSAILGVAEQSLSAMKKDQEQA
jgi:K+/H+ antiporter YhaU regulatory subunit KhtT